MVVVDFLISMVTFGFQRASLEIGRTLTPNKHEVTQFQALVAPRIMNILSVANWLTLLMTPFAFLLTGYFWGFFVYLAIRFFGTAFLAPTKPWKRYITGKFGKNIEEAKKAAAL